ncbi:MAG: DUF1707 domain-containing protein [Gemmatimonadetes bacterium]|nr:DUF1707 domain-containing protein [Gemmatimonadota bacterium]
MSGSESDAGPSSLLKARDQTIEALCEHFAHDALTLPEFERRVDLAHRAISQTELARLVGDLPALPVPAGTAGRAPAPAAPPPSQAVSPVRVRDWQLLVAILGGAARRGRWIPPRRLFIYAFWGGADLDFREAQFGPGVMEVTVVAIMGGASIVVPPGLAVEAGGVAIMGGFDHVEEVAGGRDPTAPILKIHGLVLMGGVEIDVRQPGETKSEARRRRRQERKRLRDG